MSEGVRNNNLLDEKDGYELRRLSYDAEQGEE